MSKTAKQLFIQSCGRVVAATFLVVSTGVGHAQDAGEIDMKMANLASQLSSRIDGTAGWRVAVVPFTTGGGLSSEMADYMVRSLSTQLINRTSIDLVERQLLGNAMSEMKLQQSGAFDKSSMVELGKLLGANAVITGTATPFKDALAVHAVVIDVQKGLNIGAGSVHLLRDQRPAGPGGNVTQDRRIQEPALSGPRVQQFANHRVEAARVQRMGDSRIGVWLRYVPTATLSYVLVHGSGGCTAQITTNTGTTLRCVQSSLPSLNQLPGGTPLQPNQAVIVYYEFEGIVEQGARFQFNAVNSIAPQLLSSPIRSVQRVTVTFTDLVAI